MKTSLLPVIRSLAASAGVLLTATAANAAVDRPSLSGWGGTAYRTGGWFTFLTKSATTGVGLDFNSSTMFLLSPLYSAPIRHVVVAAQQASSTRALVMAPFPHGAEGEARPFDSSRAVHEFDFAPSAGITAFRIFSSGGSGSRTISDVCVFYGERDAADDAVYCEMTGHFPPPCNLRAESFSTGSLTVAADSVGGASGYCFKVERIDGVPETVVREDFPNAPELSASTWTITSSHAKLSAHETYYDSSVAVKKALKIEADSNTGDVVVGIETPTLEAAVTECSYFCRVGATGKSDEFAVYGLPSAAGDWEELGRFTPVGTGGTNIVVAVSQSSDYRRVRFVFSAQANSFSIAAMDSLRVVYGGNETRTTVADGSATNELPRLELSNLETARYAFRAKAVGAGYGDSQWTDEHEVDLAWADVVAAAPENVAVGASGGTLHVSWDAAAGAASYRVVAVSVEDSDVVVAQETTGTTCDLALPAAGEYEVTVTAFSPGGMTSASAAAQSATVALGAVGAVSAEATDDGEITATWAAVPLAAGYSARIFMLSDGDSTRTPVGNAYVAVPVAVFSGLDTSARYVVEVVPQPGEDASLGATSDVVDMSLVRFRRKGAAPLGVDGWSEGFDALSVMTTAADFKTVPLDYWQIAKGAATQVKLNYTSGTSSTAGGVYAFSDADRTPESFALGSLASGTDGCVFGIALVNASELAVERDMTLSFDMVQRSYRANRAAYALEWKVTDGETSILSEGGWAAVAIPDSAPYAVGDDGCPEVEYRQNVSVKLSLPTRLAPGGVLILRWRHPKTSSGPMMAIDNVRLESQRHQTALRITIR